MRRSRLLQSCVIGGAAVVVALFGVTSASAAPVVKPSPTCKVPVLTVSKTTAMPGTKVTVSGVNFSGCSAQGNPAKPTAVLTVKVGVITAAKVSEVLATTKTSATGTFSVEITVPKVPAGGEPKIALAAASLDSVTKLTYEGFATITYSAPVTTAPSTTPSAPTTESSAPSTASAPTSESTASTASSVDTPTAVPAGTGGFGAPTGSGSEAAQIALGAAGVALLAGGGIALARRRPRHEH